MIDAPRTKVLKDGPAQPLGAYLLYDGTGIWLVIAADPVEGVKAINRELGIPEDDTERYSVSGSWDAIPGAVIDVRKWWPHFTNDPDRTRRPI